MSRSTKPPYITNVVEAKAHLVQWVAFFVFAIELQTFAHLSKKGRGAERKKVKNRRA